MSLPRIIVHIKDGIVLDVYCSEAFAKVAVVSDDDESDEPHMYSTYTPAPPEDFVHPLRDDVFSDLNIPFPD